MSLSYRSAPLTFLYRWVIWPAETCVLFLLLGLLKLMPVQLASAAMGYFFRLIGPFTSWHSRSITHLRLCFPEKSEPEIKDIARRMWMNLGRNVGEYMHLPQMLKKNHIQFNGLEHLRHDTGGIIIGAHLGNWEVPSLLGRVCPVQIGLIYRQLNNPYANRVFRRRATISGADVYPKGREAGLGMLRTLRKGGYMLMLTDQQLREGIEVPFFGYPARTAISHIKLALKLDKPLYLAQTFRRSGTQIEVHFSHALDIAQICAGIKDEEQKIYHLACYINAEMEKWIIAHPEQWLWPHRRWGKHIRPDMKLK